MANYLLTRTAYRALMEYFLVALDKRPGVHPVGIRETLRRDLSKPTMGSNGDQAKTACGNLKLCAGLESVIEAATHAVGQRRLERARHRSMAEEAMRPDKEGNEDKAAREKGAMVETEGAEEEAS